MSFDPSVINFLTVGNFASNPSYEVPSSQQLVTAPQTGLFFQNSGAGGAYTLNTTGNLSNLMSLELNADYGIMVSVPQVGGGLITRQLSNSSTVTVSNSDGMSGNPSFNIVPSTSLQLTQVQINGSNAGAAHSTFNLIAGHSIGLSYVDTGTQTNLTISSSASSGPALSDPFVTFRAASELTGAQNLGLLSSGLLKNTVSGAVATLSRAVPGTDYLLPNAALTEFAALTPANGDLLYCSGGAWTLLAPGAAGQVLTTITSSSLGWTIAPADVALWADYSAVQNVDFATFKGINAGDPTGAQDVATKHYVDLHAGGAPVGAGYVITTANSSLTGADNIGLLATGLLKNTVSGAVGTLSRAVPGTDYLVPNAFVNEFAALTPANGDLLYCAGGAWTLLAPGSTGQVLTVASPTSIHWAAEAADASLWSTYPALQNVNFATFKGINAADPTSAQDVATKHYVDVNSAPVGAGYVITTANSSLTGATNLGGLSTGFVLSTVSGGVSTVTTVSQSSFQPADLTATVSTTDATPTTLVTVAVSTSQAVTIRGSIVAKNSAFTAAVGGTFSATAINNGGTVTLMGTPLVAVYASSTETFNLTVSSTNVILQVTGIAATNYSWAADYVVSTL